MDLRNFACLQNENPGVAECREMGISMDPLKLRLIRVENDGKVQVLVTTLTDTQRYPIEIFRDLYHSRWPVEEDYKAIKCRLELENFTGKSVLSVYQDFHAKVFSKNLVSVLTFPLKDSIETDTAARKYEYKVNFTQALSKSKGVIALLFQGTGKIIAQLIADLQQIFRKTIEPIRPEKSIRAIIKRKTENSSHSTNPLVNLN
jgi:hypothetical protein